jgi:hypothetical protein
LCWGLVRGHERAFLDRRDFTAMEKGRNEVATFEYKTEVLTSMVGREKLRLSDLDDTLRRHGAEAGSSSR